MQAASASTADEARYSGTQSVTEGLRLLRSHVGFVAGVRDAVQRIVRAEGVTGLFKGMQVKMFQTVLGAALMMAVKEQVYGSTRKAVTLLTGR